GLPEVPAQPWWRPLVEAPDTGDMQLFAFVRAGNGIPCDGVVETVRPVVRVRPVPWDPRAYVLLLHAAAGSPRHWTLLRQLPEFGEDACDIIFEFIDGTAEIPTGVFDRDDPREIAGDFFNQVRAAAQAFPERFLHNV